MSQGPLSKTGSSQTLIPSKARPHEQRAPDIRDPPSTAPACRPMCSLRSTG